MSSLKEGNDKEGNESNESDKINVNYMYGITLMSQIDDMIRLYIS